MTKILTGPQSGDGVVSVGGRKESRYEVHLANPQDLERILEIEGIKWGDQAASGSMITSRLHVFPEGQLVATHVTVVGGVEIRRKLVAWSTVMLANETQIRAFRSWDRVTSSGTISDHDPRGNVVVGVNLTSVTEGATYILLGEILASVVEGGKTKLIGGSRLNGFKAFNERRRSEGKPPFSAERYAQLREVRGYRINELRYEQGFSSLTDEDYTRTVKETCADGDLHKLRGDETPDYVCSNLRGYLSIPGSRVVEVIPNYFTDPASDNYGVVIVWPNPLPRPIRYLDPIKKWVSRKIRLAIQDEWQRRKKRVRELADRKRALLI